MDKIHPSSTRRSMLNICIDESELDLFGRLESPLMGSQDFAGAVDMLSKMSDYYDIVRFPQRSFKTRSFMSDSAYRRKRKKIAEEGEIHMREAEEQLTLPESESDFNQTRGKQATFMVHVMLRHNATWQGRIQWLEQGNNATFNSALEMIELMMGALGRDGETAQWQAENGEG